MLEGHHGWAVLEVTDDANGCIRITDIVKGQLLTVELLGCSDGILCWQSILVELKKLKLDDRYYQVIIDDLISLLTKKGFESFKDMHIDFDVDINQENFYSFCATDSSDSDFDMNSKIKGANTL